MVTCSALNCSNSSSKKLTTGVKGWHEVPSHDKVLRAAWIHAMQRDPPYPSQKNFVLCGLHFAEECFEHDLKVSFVLKSGLSSSCDPM